MIALVHTAGAAMVCGSLAFGLIGCSVLTEGGGIVRRALVAGGFLTMGAMVGGLGLALVLVV